MEERASVEHSRAMLRRRIAELEAELSQARESLSALDLCLALRPATQSESAPSDDSHALVHAGSTPAEKIALFMERFAGRSDVYANRWVSRKTGKSGWSPAVRGGFYRDDVLPTDYLPFTAEVVDRHLRGVGDPNWHAGICPMLENDHCRFLACDFDDGEWRHDAAAYVSACRDAGIDVLAEISRSGEGAHIWMFFEQSLPAVMARAAGAVLLRRAMTSRPEMSFDSYDRFFPSQDRLPIASAGRARLGNLIALPLHGTRRRANASVFADPQTWEPHGDQFAALAKVALVRMEVLKEVADTAAKERVGPAESLPPRPKRAAVRSAVKQHFMELGADVSIEQRIELRLGSLLHVPLAPLPGLVITDLKHLSSIPNPDFYLKQAQRRSTYGTPRHVTCFEQDSEELRIPRGLLDEAQRRLEDAGFQVSVTKPRRRRPKINVDFNGTLRPDQRAAIRALSTHNTGVLVAPPGSGKTVMACALIAKRKTPTAILIGNRELLAQWRSRLQEFLSISEKQIGQLGAGRHKRRGVVDLIMWQSISHRDGDPSILNEYGQIIIDECHGIAAPAVEAALRQVEVPRWVGLTATPYRADKMDGLITMQCGPIRHTMTQEKAVARELHTHETQFTTSERGDDGPSIQAIYTELAHDDARNKLVVDHVVAAASDGHCSLVLTNRLDHLEKLTEGIASSSSTPTIQLHGRLTAPERREVRSRLQRLVEAEEPFTLVAIDKVAGEGLDLPTLDTLFLAVPISFKGRVVQQIGRITRGVAARPGRTAVVHDFHDSEVPLFDVMYSRRRRVMKKEGFTVVR